MEFYLTFPINEITYIKNVCLKHYIQKLYKTNDFNKFKLFI